MIASLRWGLPAVLESRESRVTTTGQSRVTGGEGQGVLGRGKATNLHLHIEYVLELRMVERVQIQDRYTVQRKHVHLG